MNQPAPKPRGNGNDTCNEVLGSLSLTTHFPEQALFDPFGIQIDLLKGLYQDIDTLDTKLKPDHPLWALYDQFQT